MKLSDVKLHRCLPAANVRLQKKVLAEENF